MNEWYTWFFDGLGTELISLLIGIAGGGFLGYRAGKRKERVIQKQIAGKNSDQFQEGNLKSEYIQSDSETNNKAILHQVQKAGDESTQKQVGRQSNV